MTIFLDSNIIIIYAVERAPAFAAKVDVRLAAAITAGDDFGASEAIRFECVVAPIRAGDAATLAKYDAFFHVPHVRYFGVNPAVWERGAQIRAQFGYGPMDALHFATAVEHRCGLFLTADARLARFTGLPVEVIS